MKNKLHILIALLAMTFVGCTPDEPRTGEMEWGVQAAWRNGLDDNSAARTTRALPVTNILADGTADIVIATEDYPATIQVDCKKGEDLIKSFTLTKGAGLCGEHPEYWSYTPDFLFRKNLIKREDYKFYASATIDDGKDELVCVADKDSIHGRHMFLTLHHTKALLRFAFKVDARYDKVRYIKITNVNLNDVDIALVDAVLTTTGQLIAYAYIDPTVVTTSYTDTIRCTYNIYDKDDFTDAHLTRKDVVAQNTFKLGSLKDASDNPVSTIQAGYYYDLKVTLNPEYLYVMSEHDNKHLTID